MTAAVAANLIATAALAVAVLALADYVRRTASHVQQTHDAARELLAHVPGKSAPRTDGAGQQPRTYWQRIDQRAPLLARLAGDLRQVHDRAATPAGGRHRAPENEETTAA